MSTEERHKTTFGIDDFIDKANLIEQDEIYPCLLECLVGEENAVNIYSVEIISSSCTIYKYYSEEAAVAVQTHFTRSLQGSFGNFMNTKTTESEVPLKTKTGRWKRKPKNPPTAVPSSYNPCISTAVPNHPYARPPTKPHTTFLVPARVEMFTKLEPHYAHQSHCFHYNNGGPSSEYPVKSEYNCRKTAARQPAYKAFCNGKTLIEVYSPTVGRGFNPRYNSLLIEPTIQPYLPAITGQCRNTPPTQADMQAFLHLAVEFNIPNCHDTRQTLR